LMPSAFCGRGVPEQTTSERLAEAKTARHKIAVSGLASYTTTNGETYTKHSLGQLNSYIDALEAELVAEADDGYGFEVMGMGRVE